jgi:hypothetical protein
MALTRVAADAGFSSGAIYARCDDRSELVVLAWEKSFWPMLSEILSLLIESVLSRSTANSEQIRELFERASHEDAIPDLGSAMEVIVASRRDEVIAEVVQRDINGLMEDHGVGPSTDGADRQAVVGAICTVFGAALLNSSYSNESIQDIDPFPFLESFMVALQRGTKPSKPAELLGLFPTRMPEKRHSLKNYCFSEERSRRRAL